MKKEGIVLIALGNADYIKMAYNLAVSIKSIDQMPITLVDNNNLAKDYLNQNQQSIFDQIIDCPKDFYQVNGVNSFVKSKVHLYQLTPYEKTLFLDSDTAWNPYKKPSDLFNELAGTDVTFKNTGYYSIKEGKAYHNDKYTYWFDIDEMVNAYSVKADNVYQIQSEFIYFEKSKVTSKFFDDARKVYENPKVKSKIPFANQYISDEMAFSISMALNDMKPHKINWIPTYWHFLSKDRIIENQYLFTNSYYALSIGGTYAPEYIMKFYSNIIKKAFKKYGGIPFSIKTKTKQN